MYSNLEFVPKIIDSKVNHVFINVSLNRTNIMCINIDYPKLTDACKKRNIRKQKRVEVRIILEKPIHFQSYRI